MLISYDFDETRRKIYFAYSIEILNAPMTYTSGLELMWLHSLLEIAYYFVPYEDPVNEVFTLLNKALKLVYFRDYFGDSFSLLQRLFIITMLKCFGFFPDLSSLTSFPSFEELLLRSVDFPNVRAIKSLQNVLNNVSDKEINYINKWIKRCLSRHPSSHSLKSVSFLNI